MENQTPDTQQPPEASQSPAPVTPETPPFTPSPVQEPSPAPAAPAPLTPTATNGLAIAGLIVGIIAFLSGWIPIFGLLIAIVAVILSIIGLRKGGPQKGMAIAGLITGGLGLLWSLIVGTFFIIGIIAGISSYNEFSSSLDKNSSQSQQQANQDSDDSSSMSNSKEVAGYTITANKVTRDYKPQNTLSDDSTEYVVVNLTVKNNSNMLSKFVTGNISLNADGKSSPVSLVSVDPSLNGADIPTGKSATGNLVFQIPKGADMLMLEYKQTVIDAGGKQTEKVTSIHVE